MNVNVCVGVGGRGDFFRFVLKEKFEPIRSCVRLHDMARTKQCKQKQVYKLLIFLGLRHWGVLVGGSEIFDFLLNRYFCIFCIFIK